MVTTYWVIFLKGEDSGNHRGPSFRLPGAACCPELESSSPSSGRVGVAPAHTVLHIGAPWALLLLTLQGQETVALGMEGQHSVWWFGAWAWESCQGLRLPPTCVTLFWGSAQPPPAF